ncbi:DUF4255 domain-containing protein [Streptomyces sp. NPDC001868]|uniref:DUF4255 domain-containing protein n=1 Tax=Streptomyces sp. NPDC001868 TaxID=3154401 RepID=UPI00332BC5AD
MSNSLAIAASTSTLRYVLDTALGSSLPGSVGGAQVTTLRPDRIGADDLARVPGINVFLYLVTRNAAWHARSLPHRGTDGAPSQRPVTALDLHYLITCYGQDSALEAERLLGRAVDALAVTPVLGPSVVAAAVRAYGDADETAFLKHTDLADQIESVRLFPAALSVDELWKIWSVFPQTPYLLSIGYTAGVVLLTGETASRTPLPVAQRAITVGASGAPCLRSVVTDPPDSPVLSGMMLTLHGERLLGPTTQVRIGPARPAVRPGATSTRLTVTVDAQVPAGTHAVQVLHLTPSVAPDPPSARVTAASNSLPVVVRPAVAEVTAGPTDIVLALDPPLFPGQHATVLLLRLDEDTHDARGELCFVLPPIGPDAPAQPSVTVPRAAVTDGRWLVRIQVDGVDSLPHRVDGVYQAPAITLPAP